MPKPAALVCCSACEKPVHRIELPHGRTVEDLSAGYTNARLRRCPHQDCRATNIPYLVKPA